MSSLHNDIATWAGKARSKGYDTIEIDVETADRIVEALTRSLPAGVVVPVKMLETLLVENEQHQKHLRQIAERVPTVKLDEYLALLANTNDRLRSAIGGDHG